MLQLALVAVGRMGDHPLPAPLSVVLNPPPAETLRGASAARPGSAPRPGKLQAKQLPKGYL